MEGQIAEGSQKTKPHDGVPGSPGVGADLQGPQPLRIDGRAEPLGLHQAPIDRQPGVLSGEAVVADSRGHG